jgi:hypothetical protein
MGQLKFQPATEAGFVHGVADITIPIAIKGTNIFDVVNSITNTLSSTFGSNLRDRYDHVVYAIPPGTTYNVGGPTGWLAFAYMNSYLSVYNGHNIAFISNQVHETGHNLGLMHVSYPVDHVLAASFIAAHLAHLLSSIVYQSSHGGVTYGDQSGTMGYGYGR